MRNIYTIHYHHGTNEEDRPKATLMLFHFDSREEFIKWFEENQKVLEKLVSSHVEYVYEGSGIGRIMLYSFVRKDDYRINRRY